MTRIGKIIRLTIHQLFKRARVLSQSVAKGLKNWGRHAAVSQAEAERLDRIRNPSKYLGK
jgi:hypothetical protein